MRPTRGQPAQVEFDAAWVLAREEQRGDVLGFYHTHPFSQPLPSETDLRTMRAWASAFGKPLLCLIESIDGLAAFRFDDDDSPAMKLRSCELFPRGVVIAWDDDSGRPEDVA